MGVLFGKAAMEKIPDPNMDWKAFTTAVNQLVTAEGKQYNPSTKKITDWIDMKQLEKVFPSGGGGGFGHGPVAGLAGGIEKGPVAGIFRRVGK